MKCRFDIQSEIKTPTKSLKLPSTSSRGESRRTQSLMLVDENFFTGELIFYEYHYRCFLLYKHVFIIHLLSQVSCRMPGVPEFNQVGVHKYILMIFIMT